MVMVLGNIPKVTQAHQVPQAQRLEGNQTTQDQMLIEDPMDKPMSEILDHKMETLGRKTETMDPEAQE